ncbi:MAG: zinc-ribbon domain-containing protein [Nitrospiraceae bacterium]|nr:zinc-ribbon domain-containing protein [Nitrospiraceae bacterium]
MICSNCGSELEDGDGFCSYCDTYIEHIREAQIGE